MIFIAVILDPRTKLMSLEFWFKVLGPDRCVNMKKRLRSILDKLYDHYSFGESSSQVQHGSALSQGSSTTIKENESANIYFMNRFHKYLSSTSDIGS
jgi:hypothetical protein